MEKHYDYRHIGRQMQRLWEESQIYKFNPNNTGEMVPFANDKIGPAAPPIKQNMDG